MDLNHVPTVESPLHYRFSMLSQSSTPSGHRLISWGYKTWNGCQVQSTWAWVFLKLQFFSVLFGCSFICKCSVWSLKLYLFLKTARVMIFRNLLLTFTVKSRKLTWLYFTNGELNCYNEVNELHSKKYACCLFKLLV